MNIYEKIEKIFQNEVLERPKWADEILQELRDIKAKLHEKQTLHKQVYSNTKDYNGLYNFIQGFRKSMRADVINNIYPEVEYGGKKYGVNFNGLLYEKETSVIVTTEEAKRIYRFLYENKHKVI